MRARRPAGTPPRLPEGATAGAPPRGRSPGAAALALLALALPCRAAAQEGGPRPRGEAATGQRVDYVIHARLDGESKELTGRETIVWTNGSRDSVSDLWFHLYLNAFANNRSTHLVEAKGKLRGRTMKEGWGWSRVTALAAVGAGGRRDDLLPSLRFEHPDDDNAEDRTVFSVRLPRPVPPGGKLELELEWHSQLPRVRRRTGYKDDFLLIAQWFPKLGVYEEGRGWNAHQFHMSSEFYSAYGSYDVTLDLPAEYEDRVGGSGVVTDTTRVVDRVQVRFVAPSPADQQRTDATGRQPLVHDFTWTADADWTAHEYVFRAADWAPRFPAEVEKARRVLGPRADELRDVRVTVLVHPEHDAQARRHFEAASAALFFYGLWFGGYPYEHLTVVDPAWGADQAGGMEYPTLFTCGTRLFTTPEMHSPESVTVHECGHQFWYGLVGNNEFEAAWLDEGFNSYTDSEVLWRVYGPRRSTTDYARVPVDGVPLTPAPGGGVLADALSLRKIPLPFVPDLRPLRASGLVDFWRDQPGWTFSGRETDPRWHDRVRYLSDPWIDPVDTPAWEYVDRSSYGTNSYPRTAANLRTLRALVGDDAFLRGMRHYAEQWRYRHPYPDDFFQAFQEGAGLDEDLSWFFDDFFRGTETVDWSVSVDQRRRPEARGAFPDEHGAFVLLEREDDGDDSAVDNGDDGDDGDGGNDDEASEDDGRPWVVDLVLRREGGLRLPLEVRMEFEDGEPETFVWTREQQAQKRWLRRRFESERKLKSVVLDPDRGYYVDGDMSDNQWYDDKDSVTPLRWAERAFTRMARLLQWQGGLGG